MVGPKVPLTQLLSQIGELVAAGEDSGSQASDGSVPVRLRSVVLALLDQVAASATVRPRDIGSILKLVNLALTRVPSMFAADNRHVLTEVLERVIPMLSRTQLAEVQREVVETCTGILAILVTANPALFASIIKGFLQVLEDAFGVAMVLSLQPEMSATIACFPGVLGEADSAAPAALQLPLDSCAECEMLLGNVLAILAQAGALRPLALLPAFSQHVLRRVCALLLSNSTALQGSAMQLLSALLLAAPCPHLQPLDVAASLRAMLQQQGCVLLGPASEAAQQVGSGGNSGASRPTEQWWEQLLSLLHALLGASLTSSASEPAVSAVAGLALQAAPLATRHPATQRQLCLLFGQAVAHHPQVVEHQVQQLLQLLPSLSRSGSVAAAEAGSCSDELCRSLLLYVRQHAATTVRDAFSAVAKEAGEDGEQEGTAAPSARKRRRLRLSPQHAVDPAAQKQAAEVPAGLQAVVAAIWGAIKEAQAQLSSAEGQAAGSGPLFLTLLRLAAAAGASPSLVLGLCTPLLPTWMDAGRSGSGGPEDSQRVQRLLQACEGLLAAIPAALEVAAGGGAHAAVSLAAVQPAQLQRLLEAGWEAVSKWDAPAPAKARGAALLLSTALAATQAELAEGAELLQQLFSAVHAVALGGAGTPTGAAGGAAAEGSGQSSGALQRVFGLLLPPACAVALARDEAHGGSQPRATQAAARKHSHHHAATQHPPRQANPLVATLQQLVCSLADGLVGDSSAGGGALAQQAQRAQRAAAGAARGLLTVLQLSHQPAHLVESAVHLALWEGIGMQWASRWGQGPDGSADCQPVLATAVADWVRPALEQLCTVGDDLKPQVQVDILRAVGSFLLHAAPGQLEHSRPLASWALRACCSKHAAVRAAAAQQAPLLTAPQVILALYHEGPHPIHTKDRAQAVEGHECKLLQALKSQLEAADNLATKECVLQVIGQVGARLASHNAQLLLLAILVLRLDSPDACVRAAAAEVLAGVAEARRSSLRDLLFSNPKLLEMVGRNLPTRPDLLGELAELVELEERQLAQALLPHALPALVAVQGGLEALAQQAGLEPRRMLHDYGHHAVAKQLFDGSDSFDGFVNFTEAMMGQDFVVFVRSIMPRTIMEIVMQAGGAAEWGTGSPVPEGILQRASSMLQELSSIACEGKESVSVAEFLADGDHVTRTLKEFGDLLEKKLLPSAARPCMSASEATSALRVLRCIALLIRLTGPFIGRFLPQLMVLLTSALRPLNPREVKLQGLEGWHMLVHALAEHAPVQLGGVVNQVVVALLDCLQEAGPVCAAAARIIEQVVVICKKHQPGKLRGLPPLPHWVQELERANQVLSEERGNLPIVEQVELLIQSLGDHSLSVRATALQELRSVLHARRDWVSRTLGGGGGQGDGKNEALLSRLMGALLKCCDPEKNSMSSLQAQQACAECLGLLGAIDPSRIQLDLQPPQTMCRNDGELVMTLVTTHLVRLLKTAPSLQVLDAATFAIQELLKHYARHGMPPVSQAAEGGRSREGTPVDGNALFNYLPKDVQAIVRPYLESKYSVVNSVKKPLGAVFQPSMSFRRWLSVWMEQLVGHHASGERLKLFRATITVFRHDVPCCMFLLPYLVHNVVALGGDAARAGVQQELEAVLRGGASSREGGLCLQAVFALLDVMHKWGEEAKEAAAIRQARGEAVEDDWEGVRSLLSDIPKDLLAQAASQCGAHARALQYFEMHVRAAHGGGGLNPAALNTSTQFTDAQVTFLQEVYGRLEEPDGLEGLVKLRQGGPRPEDQRLAAEKAGNWSEAATLYEQALQHSTAQQGTAQTGRGEGAAEGGLPLPEGGLSPTQHGYLSCLLHMGHLQGLLTQVEGLAVSCDDRAALQLASLGTAAAWRLGKWELLEGYLRVVDDAPPVALDPTARWEVRLGRLLWAASRRDEESLRRELESARAEVMGPFSAAAMESYSRAYPHLVKLHMLQEVADIAGLLHKPMGPHERQRALRWDERLAVTQSSLATQEPILALRRQLANLSGASAEAGQCWLQLSKLCRMTGHYDAATTAVLEATSCKAHQGSLEGVMLLWEKGEQHRAIAELQQLELRVCPKGGAGQAKPESRQFQAQVVLQLAHWMAVTGQGIKEEITRLFQRAETYDPKWETVYFRHAVYLDQLMTDAKRRQEGSDKAGSSKVDRLGGKSRIRLGEDRPYLEYLPDVVKYYGTCMLHGRTHIYQALPRLLTLWFELGSYAQVGVPQHTNQGKARGVLTAVLQHITDFASQIPMNLWLTALPQLISRLCHTNKDVSEITKGIIAKILNTYPQQCLWALAAVAKSNMAQRRAAFTAIQAQVKKHTTQESTKKLIAEHTGFWEQLIKLCHHNNPSKPKAFSARKEFSHLVRTLPLGIMMPVMSALTVTLPPGGDKGSAGTSSDVVTIEGMVDEVELLQSLQKPKKVKFIGSDGRQYCFLAKPKDDLRKDNRMMEAAGILNSLFAEDPGARRRNLYLRRFAVIPLTEEAGLVEWVPNTTGLRHCLQEVYAAEGLYVRSTNSTIRKTYDTFTGKRRAELLDKVLSMFPPRFHRWQLAKFPEPAAWLNARLAFTRTAAVWCMVGHIVGLGDRHGENILVDQSNGDVVHVDFSCLFDKGLTLEKPEMVPFRLTQNVIDGFGVAGCEGVYRRVCETTLKVLRAHRDTILSVMDTFVHDPLVEWARGGGVGRMDAEAENPMAKDAMATIEGRLTGTLLGVSSQPCLPLSVEGQAHRLIAEATDKENLGCMYIWWMPWW